MPGAVEDDRERLARLAVLGEAGRGVSVVVLHLDESRPCSWAHFVAR